MEERGLESTRIGVQDSSFEATERPAPDKFVLLLDIRGGRASLGGEDGATLEAEELALSAVRSTMDRKRDQNSQPSIHDACKSLLGEMRGAIN